MQSKILLAFAVVFMCGFVFAADTDPETTAPVKAGALPGKAMDHGLFVTAAISDAVADFAKDAWPTGKGNLNFAYKGIAIRLNGSERAAMCFDTDLMRFAYGWTGDYLKLDNTMLGALRGTVNPSVAGTIKFSTKTAPGWSTSDRKDPRTLPYGPLPKTAAHYKGLYLHENDVILSYTVGDAAILDMPGCAGTAAGFAFTRTIHIEKSSAPLTVWLCDVDAASGPAPTNGGDILTATLETDSLTQVAILNGPKGATLSNANGSIELKLPALSAPATFKAVIWNGTKASAGELAATLKEAGAKTADLPALCKGGTPRWAQTITTQAEMGKDTGAYTVDTITLPTENPWKAWVRSSGFDFLGNDKIVVCEISGDVWIASGIQKDLGKLTWKRFATGLYEPMGIKVVDGQIYVLGRDQITRLHDLNGDGEADFYENFNNDRVISPNYHAFAFDLQTDSAGNFYYGICGHRVKPGLPNHACVIRVSKDGSKLEEYATGLRSPNGFGMGPGDILTYGDNQGNYTPASKVTRVKQGAFHGYKSHIAEPNKITDYEKPIFWLPMVADNSCGGQAWVPDERWGPYKGQMIHLSYGKAALFLTCTEEVNGKMQGGAVKIPLQFASGVMRARFSPADGQLYVAGTRGWQTAGSKDGCLNRVRYTGKPAYYPTALHVKPNGIEITFPCTMDPSVANDAGAYGVEQWNYNYSAAYGSPEFSVESPSKKGHDTVEVKSAKLSPDGKTLFLELPGVKPVMQMMIKYKLKAADGSPVSHEIFNTINAVPGK